MSSAIERVFARNDVSTIMGTAQASGLTMGLAARRGSPRSHAHTLRGQGRDHRFNGRADKRQMTTMVTKILRLDAPPKPADAADALAIAICHSWRGALSAQSTPGQNKDLTQRKSGGRQGSGLTKAQQQWAEAMRRTK
jgi:crossover junction endodeoxyribonuclease RuvC